MAQRDVSYGELHELEKEFKKQCDDLGVVWIDTDVREETFMDFVSQYQDGDDDPQILLNNYGYEQH